MDARNKEKHAAMENESLSERELRLEREEFNKLKPLPQESGARVYEWIYTGIQMERILLEPERVPLIWDMYRDSQKVYNSVTDEYDVWLWFAPEEEDEEEVEEEEVDEEQSDQEDQLENEEMAAQSIAQRLSSSPLHFPSSSSPLQSKVTPVLKSPLPSSSQQISSYRSQEVVTSEKVQERESLTFTVS